MSEAVPATSFQETLLFFPSGDETLFGVLTRPTRPEQGVAVILIYGGGHNVSAHVGELWTRTARRVAAHGFHAFRYDHHGNGDSTGKTGTFDHRSPFTADLRAAVACLRAEGLERFVLVGDCLGARAALHAGTDMSGLDALFLMSPMVYDGRMGRDEEWAEAYGLGHYVRRAFQWRTVRRLANAELRRAYVKVGMTKVRKVLGLSRKSGASKTVDASSGVSNGFLEPVEKVLGSGVRVNFVFGTADEERRREFDDALAGRLGRMVEKAGPLAEIATVEGGIAAHMDLAAQEGLIGLLEQWLDTTVSPTADASVGGEGAAEAPEPSIAHGSETKR